MPRRRWPVDGSKCLRKNRPRRNRGSHPWRPTPRSSEGSDIENSDEVTMLEERPDGKCRVCPGASKRKSILLAEPFRKVTPKALADGQTPAYNDRKPNAFYGGQPWAVRSALRESLFSASEVCRGWVSQ